MESYNGKVVRLSKETINELEYVKKCLSDNKNELYNYLVVNSRYDDIIRFLIRVYIDNFITGEELG